MANPENIPVILSGCRTPSGRFQGSLSGLTAPQLGALVVAEVVQRAALKDLTQVNEVLMGNVVGAGLGQNPGRQAAIRHTDRNLCTAKAVGHRRNRCEAVGSTATKHDVRVRQQAGIARTAAEREG